MHAQICAHRQAGTQPAAPRAPLEAVEQREKTRRRNGRVGAGEVPLPQTHAPQTATRIAGSDGRRRRPLLFCQNTAPATLLATRSHLSSQRGQRSARASAGMLAPAMTVQQQSRQGSRSRAGAKLGWPSLPRSHAHTPANAHVPRQPAFPGTLAASHGATMCLPEKILSPLSLSALRVHPPLALIPSLPLSLGVNALLV